MTGPEHYREAESLLRDEYRTADSIAEAQVHATLALAAATVMQAPVDGCEPGMASHEFNAWYQAAGVKAE